MVCAAAACGVVADPIQPPGVAKPENSPGSAGPTPDAAGWVNCASYRAGLRAHGNFWRFAIPDMTLIVSNYNSMVTMSEMPMAVEGR